MAPATVTAWIEREANELLRNGNRDVSRIPYERAVRSQAVHEYDFVRHYVDALPQVLDLEAIRGSGLRVAVDPLGGAAIAYWEPIAESLGLDLTVVSREVDPRFGFMPLDWDGRIRMDCSSPFAMARVLELRDDFDLAIATDTDADRFGIVTRGAGLLAPNDYLAIAIGHLFQHRLGWRPESGVGKAVVSSGLIDRIAFSLGRPPFEVPVGFKWFVDPLLSKRCAFAGEESAGASFLTRAGEAWTTDKDGILLTLLAIEMTSRAGRGLAEVRSHWAKQLGDPHYARIDVPASDEMRKRLSGVTEADVSLAELAGERVERVLTRAPGNGEPIGGVKVIARNGWFAARPSGTESLYKIYAESFLGSEHLARVQDEAKALVRGLLS
jgi:phosphoglucomutase